MNVDLITEAIAKLTPAGRDFMTLVGQGRFSFFDGGIVKGSGCWGKILSEFAASVRSASGIMTGTKKLGLWTTSSYEDDDAGLWWILTELGAAVANYLAAEEAEEAAPVAPAITSKVGKKWTYIYAADGSLIAELRNDQLAAIAAFIS